MTNDPKDKVRDALENLIIAIGMGWDLNGVVQEAREALGPESPCGSPRSLLRPATVAVAPDIRTPEGARQSRANADYVRTVLKPFA